MSPDSDLQTRQEDPRYSTEVVEKYFDGTEFGSAKHQALRDILLLKEANIDRLKILYGSGVKGMERLPESDASELRVAELQIAATEISVNQKRVTVSGYSREYDKIRSLSSDLHTFVFGDDDKLIEFLSGMAKGIEDKNKEQGSK